MPSPSSPDVEVIEVAAVARGSRGAGGERSQKFVVHPHLAGVDLKDRDCEEDRLHMVVAENGQWRHEGHAPADGPVSRPTGIAEM